MMIGRGNRSTRKKPAQVPLFPQETPTCCPDANPNRRGGKPATNRLSYGTVFSTFLSHRGGNWNINLKEIKKASYIPSHFPVILIFIRYCVVFAPNIEMSYDP
jgi:hypothetical protein